MNFLQGPRKLRRSAVAGETTDHWLFPSDPQLLLKRARGLWSVPAGDAGGAGSAVPVDASVIREQEQLLSAMFASSTIGVGIFDSELRFERLNDALAVMNGLPQHELRGRDVREILGDSTGHIEPIFRQVISSGEPALNQERSFKITTRSEPGHWVSDFFPLKNAEGKVVKVAVIVVEIAPPRPHFPSQEEEPAGADPEYHEIVGESSGLSQALSKAKAVAVSDATVLLIGESGTGKNLLARAIHRMGPRSRQIFLAVNCAAIPAGLLESELFGHEKDAFTGATEQKIGKLELANHGTLFMDEITELPKELQAKLLRVLESSEFQRVGGTRSIRSDVRIVAATRHDLRGRVANGGFRSDLYYRLNVFAITLPALRERKEDIPALAHYFARKHAQRLHKRIDAIDDRMIAALVSHDWPGNIRELDNVMERAVILARGAVLEESPGSLP